MITPNNEKIKEKFYKANHHIKTVEYPDNTLMNEHNNLVIDPKEAIDHEAIFGEQIENNSIEEERIYRPHQSRKPAPAITVNYSGLRELDRKYIDKYTSLGPVEICLYKIHGDDAKPFLSFLLTKKEHVLHWPVYTIKKNKTNVEEVVEYIKKFITSRASTITYEGRYVYNKPAKTHQLWFRYSDKLDTTVLEKYSNPTIWCLPSEIVNFNKALTFPISNDVTGFFLKHNNFLFLKDDLGKTYETPIVAFSGNYYKKTIFSSVFGTLRAGADAPHGPYYYFGTYETAIIDAFGKQPNIAGEFPVDKIDGVTTMTPTGKYKKGGIVRYAVFLENATMNINHNYNGSNWTDDANSIIVKSDITQTPGIIVQKQRQMYPLDYYFVDTTKKLPVNDNYSNIRVM